jgi:hypothetical protein
MLDVVDGVTRYDSLLMPRTLPVATGDEAEDLACGKCGETIALRAGRDTVRRSAIPTGTVSSFAALAARSTSFAAWPEGATGRS